MKHALTFVFLLVLVSCQQKHFSEGKFFAGGKYVSADKLNLGKSVYEENCFACHGLQGDGNGVAAKGLYPPVRNFKQGQFKFGVVYDGGLPHDKTLKKLIREGLHGTAMLPWDVTHEHLDAVVQYIKTFAPEVWEGKEKKLGKPIVLSPDPFGLANRKAAIQRGAHVYHIEAQCTSCHRGYVTVTGFNDLVAAYGGDRISELEEGFYEVKPQDTDYGAKMIPPDFTWHTVRSAKTVEELAYRIAAGVGGPMPTWKDVLEDDQIWATAYYVQSLIDLKDKAKRKEFMATLGQN
jgi:mono/diheme cytochrome c family protein